MKNEDIKKFLEPLKQIKLTDKEKEKMLKAIFADLPANFSEKGKPIDKEQK